jgi:hypothetical protein
MQYASICLSSVILYTIWYVYIGITFIVTTKFCYYIQQSVDPDVIHLRVSLEPFHFMCGNEFDRFCPLFYITDIYKQVGTVTAEWHEAVWMETATGDSFQRLSMLLPRVSSRTSCIQHCLHYSSSPQILHNLNYSKKMK